MGRVVHFEIHADDVERAMKFYTGLFGWEIAKAGELDYWLVTTGKDDEPGINGAITKREKGSDGNRVIAYVCTVDVSNIDDLMKSVEKLGGSVIVPKNAIPGIGWNCYCKDTEGNTFCLMQEDKEAK